MSRNGKKVLIIISKKSCSLYVVTKRQLQSFTQTNFSIYKLQHFQIPKKNFAIHNIK